MRRKLLVYEDIVINERMESEDTRKKIAATWGVYGENYVSWLRCQTSARCCGSRAIASCFTSCGTGLSSGDASRWRLDPSLQASTVGGRTLRDVCMVVRCGDDKWWDPSIFNQNSSGDLAEETRSVMRLIGATLAAEGLDAACNTFFGGTPIPADRKLRNDLLSAWDAKHGREPQTNF